MEGGNSALSIMNLITIILLIVVSVYLYTEIQNLKQYEVNNQQQLQNLVNDINYNNYIISNSNDKLLNLSS